LPNLHWLKGGIYEEACLTACRCGACRVTGCGPKERQADPEAEEIAKQHDNTRRALRDALPLVLPSWSLPFYFGMHLDETTDQKKKK
jgi:hypothetical protein